MKSTLKLTALLVFVSPLLYSQPNKNERQYLDKNFQPEADSTKAEYYRELERDAEGWIVADFYRDGKPQMVARCKAVAPSIVKDGPAYFHYRNGNKKRYGNYRDDKPVGLFREFYENGQPESEIFYGEKKTYYWQHWNAQGKPMLVNGTGFVSNKSENATTYREVKDSLVLNSFSIENGQADTVYLMVEQLPEYRGGYTKMMDDIRASMTYPRSARRSGIDGTVYVSMVIDKSGNVTDTKILRSLQTECDEVALQAVRKLKPWIPGRVHNRAVPVRFVLPIKFKLN